MISTSDYAALLRHRPSCSSPREDAIGPRVIYKELPVPGNPWDPVQEPLFFRVAIRPVKVVLLTPSATSLARRPAFFLPIWKCATSYLSEGAGSLLSRLYGCARDGGGRCHGPHEHYNLGTNRLTSRVLLNGSVVARFRSGPSTAHTDFAATATAAGAVSFTVVREPLARFVSGWWPRSDIPVCTSPAGGRVPCERVLASMEAHVFNISVDGARWPWWRQSPGHYLSQCYFLSATDARGKRVTFDHVVRLENFGADMRVVAAALGVGASEMEAELPSVATAPRRNGNANENKKSTGVVALYAEALQRRPAFCTLCAVLERDYECLGYPRPAACAACATRSATEMVRDAPATDCSAKGGVPYECRLANLTAWEAIAPGECMDFKRRSMHGRKVYDFSGRRCVLGKPPRTYADHSSPMCNGSDTTGSINLGTEPAAITRLRQLRAQCVDDDACVGYYIRRKWGASFYIPVVSWARGRVLFDDPHMNEWQSYTKDAACVAAQRHWPNGTRPVVHLSLLPSPYEIPLFQ